MSSHNFTRRLEQTGFALVITLILVAVVAVIVVGFLGHAVNDRATAATGGERFRAELAAQSGLEAAKGLAAMTPSPTPSGPLVSKTANDYFIVTSSSDANGVPYYFVGCADGGTVSAPTAQYYPLYSGGTIQTGLSVSATPKPSPTPSAITRAQQTIGAKTINYPRLFSSSPHSTWQQNINTSWQTVDNTIPATAEHTRYTYWVEDLAGYVDANVAGNTDGTSSTHFRSLGYDPKEVALFTLFANTSQTDPGNTWATTLVGDHPILLTPWTTRVGGTANSANDQVSLASLVANLSTDFEQNVIPFGLGYQNQGQPKTNLNSIITNTPNDTGVTQIANAISADLPNFAAPSPSPSRKGGLLSTQDYIRRLPPTLLAMRPARRSLAQAIEGSDCIHSS